MVALGLQCWALSSSSCELGLLFAVVYRLLIAVASLEVEHRLWRCLASGVAAHGLDCSTARGILQDQGLNLGFPGSPVGNESACNAGHPDSIPGWGRSPGEGNGNPLQYSCRENPKDRGAWQATIQESSETRDCIVRWILIHSTTRDALRKPVWLHKSWTILHS